MRRLLIALAMFAGSGAAQAPRLEAGVHAGVLDLHEVFGEKYGIAGGRATVRLVRFLAAEAEIDRYPIGGAFAAFPATEFLIGARAGARVGPLGLFATVRPGWIAFGNRSLKSQDIGTRPAVNLGIAIAFYSTRHVFGRFDFGDLIVGYGPSGYGTRHQFQGTAGLGVWF